MERASLLGISAVAPGKAKQIRAAQDMMKIISDRAQMKRLPLPPYDLLELIGQGAFGRVFKARVDPTAPPKNANSPKFDTPPPASLVAVKIIDVDRTDYKLSSSEKDQAIKDIVQEISILRTLKDSKAKNINLIHDAFNFHSQLWIISEYCPGGSVHTLMRACPTPGLEEKFIVAISRELAVALKYVHDADIIHRDVKAANILITEQGQVQLCDFGVSSIVEGHSAKRSTIIGTPYWMAPELHTGQEDLGYGKEIDCWAFGCTVYEMATGQPPNAKIAPKRLHLFLTKAPRLEDGDHSDLLREFVAYCLEEEPEQRPKPDDILRHPYVANTHKKYPTSSLRQLLERYAAWEHSGGNRVSLWNPGGAGSSTSVDPLADGAEDEWNFSTTDNFSSRALDDLDSEDASSAAFAPSSVRQSRHLTPFEQAKLEQRADRGGTKMMRIFDENAAPYEYSYWEEDDEDSDLPFRRSAAFSDKRETIIDLDDARASQDLSGMTDLDLADAETIRAKRTPMRWSTFDDDPVTADADDDDEPIYYDPSKPRPKTLEWTMEAAMEDVNHRANNASRLNPVRPQLMHTTTEPVGQSFDFVHGPQFTGDTTPMLSLEPPDRDSMIDLDAGFATLTRPSSAMASSVTFSALSFGTDTTEDEPFSHDLYSNPDFEQSDEVYNDRTIRAAHGNTNRSSLHAHSLSEPTSSDRSSDGFSHGQHTRGSSLASEIELERESRFGTLTHAHSRNISVKDSAESLRNDVMADQDFEDEQMVVVPPVKRRETARKWKPRAATFAVGSEEPTPAPSDVEEYPAYEHVSTLKETFRPSPSRQLARGRMRFDSDADSDATDIRASSRPYHHNRHYRVISSFPELRAPDIAALDDDAEQEVVIEELMRLLGDYSYGLQAASKWLMAEQDRRQSSNFSDSNGNGNVFYRFGAGTTPNSSGGSRAELRSLGGSFGNGGGRRHDEKNLVINGESVSFGL